MPAGGLKQPDLCVREQVILLNWIKLLWKNQDSLVSSIPKEAFNCSNIQTLLMCKSNLALRIDQRYKMQSEVLRTWSGFRAYNPTPEPDIKQEILWYNNQITIDKKAFCWRAWQNAGI